MGESPENQALRIFEPDPDAVYSIEFTERLTQIPRRTIAIYVKHRLVSPLSSGCSTNLSSARSNCASGAGNLSKG